MKEIEVKKCPECEKILLEFKEYSNNGGGLRKGLTRYYCKDCKRTYNEEDVITSIIAKKISPVELSEEKIRREMLSLRISDNKTADEARQIVGEVKSEELTGWF